MSEAAVPFLRTQEQIECSSREWMIPGEELNFLAGQRTLSITGDSESFSRQTGERVCEYSCGTKPVGPRRKFFDVDREVIEDRNHELIERLISILPLNLLHKLGGKPCSKGVHFQQPVSPFFQTPSYSGVS